MKRHTNEFYRHPALNCATLVIKREYVEEITAVYDITYENDVKLYNWSYKGKNGIMNEYNVSLGAFLAEKIGYKAGNWKRITKHHDYRTQNFTFKMNGADAARLAEIRPKQPKSSVAISCFPRKRWTSKLKCETLQVEVVAPQTHKLLGVVPVQINECYRHYIPTRVLLKDGDLVHIGSGERLAFTLYKDVGGESNGGVYPASYFARRCNLDFRIDPNSLSYVDTPYAHLRTHNVTIPADNDTDEPTEAVIFEYRERSQATIGWYFYWLHANNNELYRVPSTSTVATVNLDGSRNIVCEERTSFVMVDPNIAENIIEVYYNGKNDEFYAFTGNGKDDKDSAVLLKRYVAENSGENIGDTYVPARMTKGYAKALEQSGDKSKWDRRRARYENHGMDEKGHGCFVEGKHLKHRKVIAPKSYFCDSIYGGVGVWVKDLRACAVHVKKSVEEIRHRDNA